MVSNSKKISVPFQDLPPVNENNQYQFRYRVISEDNSKQSDWSGIYVVDNVPVEKVFGSVQFISSTGFPTVASLSWGDENDRPEYDVFVRFTYTTSQRGIANVGTSDLYFATKPNIKVGDTVIVTGGTSAYNTTGARVSSLTYNGTYYVVSYPNPLATPTAAVAGNTSIKLTTPSFFYHGTSPIHTYQLVTETAPMTPANLAGYLTDSNQYGKPSEIEAIVQISSQKKQINSLLNIFQSGVRVVV